MDEHMNGLTGSIVLIGAGKDGHALLSAMIKENDINIIGVVDSNPEAPGLAIAREHGIPVAGDFKEFLDKRPQIVINTTSDPAIANEIARYKAPDTEVIGGMSARFIGGVLEKRFRARKRQTHSSTRAQNFTASALPFCLPAGWRMSLIPFSKRRSILYRPLQEVSLFMTKKAIHLR